ncbi:translesion DNA synthesis-associated protein ImuA [uncultured Paraglaciecola sp.]|uniref:translesion DNA synthesis-associated protein ImuA n=1 Tax=uncultured Paraglaciecola sp. TaxID=1765024 RepID=UPI002592A5C7|nr:translesion DNA synthesis-associated protein ImuA [uncultured Paraglaciecola sp.]
MHPTIRYLKNKNLLWQANHAYHDTQNELHTGYQELDNALQGGFPEHGVIDIRSPLGIGELRLLLPSILLRQQQNTTELTTLIAPPMDINAEMWAEFGLSIERIMLIRPNSERDVLWSAEQSLKSGCCHSVVIWHSSLSVAQIKRLQLAAEKGHCLLFIIREPKQEQISLPVSLGLQLSPDKAGVNARVTKRKGAFSKKAFTVNMHNYWPEICQPRQSNVLTFPLRASQVG